MGPAKCDCSGGRAAVRNLGEHAQCEAIVSVLRCETGQLSESVKRPGNILPSSHIVTGAAAGVAGGENRVPQHGYLNKQAVLERKSRVEENIIGVHCYGFRAGAASA